MKTNSELNEIGNKLAQKLGMTEDKNAEFSPIRWQTEWGNKTGFGLIATLQRFMDELKDGKTTLLDS